MFHLEKLEPGEVQQNETFTLSLYGNGFTENDLVLVDGKAPAKNFITAKELEATITKDITHTKGDKIVKVQSGSGEVSNELVLIIL